jgi:CheY-like chemotaxis protein
MALLLSMKGNDVVEARDGHEAVEIATCYEPDLIFMDFKMPCLDGFADVRHLRAHSATAAIPIIAVTAQPNDKESRKPAQDYGRSDYLSKPLDFELSFSIIRAFSPARSRWANVAFGASASGHIEPLKPPRPEAEPHSPVGPESPPDVEPIFPHPVPPIPGQPPDMPGEPPAPPLIA